MTYVYLLLFAIIICLLWSERKSRQRAEQRAESLERSRVRSCVKVYNGWVGSDWFEFVKNYSKEQGLDYMALLSGIQLRDITEDDANITLLDTPETIRQRGKDGLIPWQVHPDRQEISEKFKKNVAKERDRMGVK